MNKLTVVNGNWKLNIFLNKNKVIIGQSIHAKNQIKQNIRAYFYAGDSEYRKENDIEAKLNLNDDTFMLKRTNFMEVNSDYSIVEDCKLGTKSLMAKYYECILNENEYFNSINTIDILFESLANEISDSNEFLKTIFAKMTAKQLIKLMKPYYFNEYQKDEFDLTYDEIISFQILLIQEIQKRSLYENTVILIDAPLITPDIYKQIAEIKNAYTIVLTNNYINSIDIQDVMLAENEFLDFADQYYIYEQFGEINGERKIIEEVYLMIKRYLEQKYAYKNADIVNEIKNFSLKQVN